MRTVRIAATQMSCLNDISLNIAKAESLVREAASKGAQVILLQELFSTLYFCQKEKNEFLSYAGELENNPVVSRFQKLASELDIVLPVSFYEKNGDARYNSLALIDAGGAILGTYRKSHIPDGPGYEEKFYFNPGDSGFKVWNTKYGKIGAGICWDQWFPEAARCMVLAGAEMLLYPTAIGSEPQNPSIDSMEHWRRCMTGHSACNMVPVAASNRIGMETIEDSSILFYGSSFITDARGEVIKSASRDEETVIIAEFDLDELAEKRTQWGLFRDRRPELYKAITSNNSEN